MKIVLRTLLFLFFAFSVVGIVFFLVFLAFKKFKFEKLGELPQKNNVERFFAGLANSFEGSSSTSRSQKKSGLNERQSRIWEYLKDKMGVNMQDLVVRFDDVTERTLRRDMKKLEEMDLVEQRGKTRDTHYIVNRT